MDICYCKKCGRIILIFDIDEKICDFCKSNVFPIPKEFRSYEHSINEDLKQQFIEEYIKSSPEFDQTLFNQREIHARQHANDFQESMDFLEKGKAILEEKNKKVTCTYCGSTNVKKITATSKAVHTAIFGIWSMGRNSKQWHCNNCNSDF